MVTYPGHDLLQNTTQISPTTLPVELVLLIVKRLLMIYLQTQNLESAFELCTLNSEICKVIYYQVFGIQKTPNIREMIHRLAKTFYLVESIYDEFLTVPNLGTYSKVGLVLTRLPNKIRTRNNGPWDYDLDILLEELVLDNLSPHVHAFSGPTHADTCWVQGTELNGVIDVTVMEQPVINFILQDYTDALIPHERTWGQNKFFCYFSRLLRVTFGKQTGVYYMVKPGPHARNPFITRSETLMSL